MKRHPTDWWSLVFGGLFALVGTFAIVVTETRWSPDLRWLLPLSTLVIAGLIVGGVLASRRATTGAEGGVVDPDALAEVDREVPRP